MGTQAKLVVESPFFNVSPNIVSTLDSNSKFSHRSSLRFQTLTTRRRVSLSTAAAAATTTPQVPPPPPIQDEQRKPPDLQSLMRRFWKVAVPYWSSDDKVQARLQLAAVFALTLGTTGISVGFSFLGRDFYNALANKDQEQFTKQLLYYLAGFAGGIPFFVLRDYAREKLSLRWRSWMTSYYMERYLKNKTFYKIQSQSTIDNPDQRIVDDLSSFTGTALSFSLTLFNAAIDLISFSNILFGIYPPLFGVLLAYSLGGTALSVFLGKGLVSLNFLQEKKEADFRYGLVRVRENAESIAFYGGEENEMQLLLSRFRSAFENLNQLLISSRNLDFFTSGYRYLIQILPAAVVAPMYFSGKIEFGVINQSVSAFNHILGDFSLIVYQFQALSAFSAVIDRLGMLFLDGAFFSKYMEKRFTPPKLMEALLVLPRLQKNGFAGDPLIGTTTWTEFEAKSWNADVISCRIEDDEEFYPPRESLDGRESLIGTGSASRRAFTSIEVKSFGGSSSSSSYSSSSSASGSPVRSLSLSISLLVSLSPKNSQSKSLDLLVVHTAPPPQNPYPPSLLIADFVPILVINGESDSPSPPSSSSPKRYPSKSIDTGEFDDVLDSNSKKGDQDSKEKIQLNFCLISSSNGLHSNGSMPLSKRVKLLHVEHLTVQTPSEATLIKDLSFEIFEKDHLLVTGPSGSGKTSLLRVIAGLWSFGNGAITVYVRPRGDLEMLHSPDVVSYQVTSTNETIRDSTGRRNFEGVIFLPQKPYMVLGTLRQQLLYPTWTEDSDNLSDDAKQSDSVPFLMRARDARCVNERSKKPTSEDLLQVLNDVSLGHLLSRFDGLDSTHEWSSVLSLGEQQRLAFGRLLLSKPTLALLDESTSALDEANEARLYQLIQAAGITYISIGHRRTLYKYHKKVLHVSTADSTSTQQNWSFKDVEEDPIYDFSKQ